MIYAKNFIESEKCRNSEFTITSDEKNVIVQFASNDPTSLSQAASLIYGHARGVDLNCGCPKRDVRSKGMGSMLLTNPQLISSMVKETRAKISDEDFSISIKIRINKDIKRTVDLCRMAEKAGVSHIVVHGRTVDQRNDSINTDSIRIIKDCISVPIIANGGVNSKEEALDLARNTNVDGIMIANGLLYNPALFAGYETTPECCVKEFMKLSRIHSLDWILYHQHLQYMLRSVLTAPQRRIFNELNGRLAIDNFLHKYIIY